MAIHKLFEKLHGPWQDSNIRIQNQNVWSRACLKRLIHCSRKATVDAVAYKIHAFVKTFCEFQ